MIIAHSTQELRAFLSQSVAQDASVGFVPTMGALHQGHISLVQASKKQCDVTVMSIFVNPTQFGPKEDLSSYFRPIEKDTEMAKTYGVDVLFLPGEQDIYPPLDSFTISEQTFSSKLCGAYRPGHFQGVCTVVAKLLHLVRPNYLFLGKKDAQQLRIIEKMVEDLFFDVTVVGAPTVREESGLAFSSRNGYLSKDERGAASILYKSLTRAQIEFEKGQRNPDALVACVDEVLSSEPKVRPQYVEILQWRDFARPVQRIDQTCLLAIACFIGDTRLIDNIILEI